MKKLNLLTIIIMLAFASVSYAQITGSAHDFRGKSWATAATTGEICITCHTPHNADPLISTPLWNHEVTSATFTLYNSNSLNATMDAQPSESSKMCLSCHDGTVALDNFGGRTGTGTTISGNDKIDTDLSDDHPISFTYDATLASQDGELEDPENNTEVAGMLFGGKMQCSSCHDVHNAGFANLLVKENTASALCLTCHIK